MLMKRLRAVAVSRRTLTVLAAGILVIAAFALYARRGGTAAATITVQPGDFVQSVSISGKVTPVHTVDLGFTQSGRIASVNARVGQNVGAGAVLASIDSGDLSANLAQREAALSVQEAKLASLKAGTRPEEIAVAESTVASDQTALSQAEQSVADAVQNAYIKSDDAIRNQLYQFVSNPRSANPQINFSSSDSQASTDVASRIPSIEAELVDWQNDISAVSADTAMAHADAAQTHLGHVSSLLSYASALLSRALPNATVPQSTLDTYAADIAAARTSVNGALSSLTSSVTAEKGAAAALDAAQKNLALKQAGPIQADIDAQAAQVQAAEADVENARALLNKTVIVAPFSGVVTDVPGKIGSIAQPNATVVSLISGGALQVEVYIPEVDISQVAVGDEASVTLDAYGTNVTFPATVASIDPSATVRDGVSTYKTTLQFKDSDPRIRAGMTANASITTAKIPNAISVPLGAVYDSAGSSYVQVKVGDKIETRTVVKGSVSTIGNVEIVSGLAAGDAVVLDPAH